MATVVVINLFQFDIPQIREIQYWPELTTSTEMLITLGPTFTSRYRVKVCILNARVAKKDD